MKPTLKLAETTDTGGDTLALYTHDGRYRIQSRHGTLRTTEAHSSELELGRLATLPFLHCKKPEILVGGLGLGYPLRAVLATLEDRKANIIVTEPNKDIVAWHRTHLSGLHGDTSPLDDPRVSIVNSSPEEFLWRGADALHTILIQIDGRPEDSPFANGGTLSAAHSSLGPGGVLALLSTQSDRRFEQQLTRSGFKVGSSLIKAAAKAKKGPLHTLLLASKEKADRPQHPKKR